MTRLPTEAIMRAVRAMLTVTLAAALEALASGCSGGSRPAVCASAQEGPAAVLALDQAGTNRYVFLPGQQLAVVSGQGSVAAHSSATDVAAVTSSLRQASLRYTHFMA